MLDASAASAVWEFDSPQPVVLIVGGDAQGASERAPAAAKERVCFPTASDAESLNMAIACSMFLYEVVRQRERA